ncbi:hypothetical protein BKA81DRAFT_151729 [Phyllosticta paracitricarpa]
MSLSRPPAKEANLPRFLSPKPAMWRETLLSYPSPWPSIKTSPLSLALPGLTKTTTRFCYVPTGQTENKNWKKIQPKDLREAQPIDKTSMKWAAIAGAQMLCPRTPSSCSSAFGDARDSPIQPDSEGHDVVSLWEEVIGRPSFHWGASIL